MVLLSSSGGPDDPLLLQGEGEHGRLVGGGQVQLLLHTSQQLVHRKRINTEGKAKVVTGGWGDVL